MYYTIYDTRLNGDTKNYGGLEWVIDGECGRRNYPGTYPREYCERLYMEGKSWESILKDHKTQASQK